MWTGTEVIPPTITVEQAKQWGTRMFGRKQHPEPEAGSSQGPLPTGPIGAPIARSMDAPDLSGLGPSGNRR